MRNTNYLLVRISTILRNILLAGLVFILSLLGVGVFIHFILNFNPDTFGVNAKQSIILKDFCIDDFDQAEKLVSLREKLVRDKWELLYDDNSYCSDGFVTSREIPYFSKDFNSFTVYIGIGTCGNTNHPITNPIDKKFNFRINKPSFEHPNYYSHLIIQGKKIYVFLSGISENLSDLKNQEIIDKLQQYLCKSVK